MKKQKTKIVTIIVALFTIGQVSSQNFHEDFGSGTVATNQMPGNAITELGFFGKENWNQSEPGANVPINSCPLNQGPNDGAFLILSAKDNTYDGQNGCGVTNNLTFPGWHQNIVDHTSGDGSGRYMMVNGSGTKFNPNGFIAFQKTVSVDAGIDYEFSVWIANVLKKNSCSGAGEQEVNVALEVYSGSETNTTPVATISSGEVLNFNKYGVIYDANKIWQEVSLSFTAPSNQITLVLRDKGGDGCGNDFAIDDVGLKSAVECTLEEVTFTVPEDISLCDVTEVVITVDSPVDGEWKRISGLGTIENPTSKQTKITDIVYNKQFIVKWVPNLSSCQTVVPKEGDDSVTILTKKSPTIDSIISKSIDENNTKITALMGEEVSVVNYEWSTEDGEIVSGQGTSEIIVSKTGSYTLEASLSTSGIYTIPCGTEKTFQLEFGQEDVIFIEDFGTGTVATNVMPEGSISELGYLGYESTMYSNPNQISPISKCDIYYGPFPGGFVILSASDNKYYTQENCEEINYLSFSGWIQGIKDHTSNDGNGRYMLINGGEDQSGNKNKIIYKKQQTLIVGELYNLSAWIANVIKPGKGCPTNGVYKDVVEVNVSFEVYYGDDINGEPAFSIESKDVIGMNNFAPETPKDKFDLWQQASLEFTPVSSDITIVLRDKGGDGCGNDFAIDDIVLRANNSLGGADFEKLEVGFSPNPVEDILSITSDRIIKNVQVFDLSGQTLVERQFNNHDVDIDLSLLSYGTYLIKVSNDSSVKTFKIVKE